MTTSSIFDTQIIGFFAGALKRSLSAGFKDNGFKGMFQRAGVLLNSLRFQRVQTRKREAAAAEGRTVPPILIASVTRRCNLNCRGCYSKALRGGPSGELPDAAFLRLFREASDMGVGTILIAGGEPLMRPDLLREAAAVPGVIMPVFTNGLLMDEGFMDLFTAGRLIPVFSLEGEAGFTAARRGRGIHETVLEKAAELKRRGALFGLSVTLTSQNADSVLSDRFLKNLRSLGAAVLFLVEYVPVSPGTEHLVLTGEQKAELNRPGRFDGCGINVVCLPGDEEQYGGCLAAGRGFIHVADDGRLEACPFAPYSDSNAASAGLAAALESPLMQAIR
ncbi:MAG: radical SAM protein, partial [Spirochaetales bacterium]